MIGPVWRLLDSGALDGAEQMALDSGLMDRARQTGETVLRVYRWTRPTLSFGRHETVAGHFDRARLAAAGVDAVRRPTGGRVLLHDREVTYSVTAPIAADESLRVSYSHCARSVPVSGRRQNRSPGGRAARPVLPSRRLAN
jgi:lipoate-protein ligase A